MKLVTRKNTRQNTHNEFYRLCIFVCVLLINKKSNKQLKRDDKQLKLYHEIVDVNGYPSSLLK